MTDDTDELRRKRNAKNRTTIRLLPHATEAEEAVLGAMLLRAEAVAVAASTLVAEDFYAVAHGTIFDAAVALHERGSDVDVLTVSEHLRARGLLDTAGGTQRLLGLQTDTPGASGVAHWAAIVAEHSQRRQAIIAANAVIEAAHTAATLDEVLALMRPPAHAAANRVEVHPVHRLLAHPPEQRQQLVEDLVQPGELIALAAGRGIGKSWALMDLAAKVADGRGLWLDRFPIHNPELRPVLYCHGEMDARGSWERWRLLIGDGTISERLIESCDTWQITIAKTITTRGPERTETTRAIIPPAFVDLLEQQRPCIVVLDPWRVFFGGIENDNDAMNSALVELAALARRIDCAIVLAHHFGKGDVTQRLDPEDMWRGASVLADRVHTRITLSPHYATPAKVQAAAKRAGIDATEARHWARRFADVSFLRRSSRSPSAMSIEWTPTDGRWHRWEDTNGDIAERLLTPIQAAKEAELQTVLQCALSNPLKAGGFGFESLREASEMFGFKSPVGGQRFLDAAIRKGMLMKGPGRTGGSSYRLTPDFAPPPDEDVGGEDE